MYIDRRSLITAAMGAPLLVGASIASAQDDGKDPAWMILAGDGSGPFGRWGHNLVMDTWNNRLLVAGGRDEIGTVLGDLWSFDLGSSTWSELDLSGPKARSGSAAAAAPDGSGFYYFAGESNSTVFDDLWWFDFAASNWEQIETPAGVGPSARSGTRGTVDSLGRFVISHGCNGHQLFDDTWAFDPTTRTWSDISPSPELRPMARCDHEMVSLPDYGLILLSGGCSDGIGPCPQGDLWALDSSGEAWTEITPYPDPYVNPDTDPDILPYARTDSAMSRLGNTVLMVGGLTDLGRVSDVWKGLFLEGGFEWTELTYVNHGPAGIYRRFGHDMTAYGDEFYVFGGNGVEGALGDLWQFSLSRMHDPSEEGEQIVPD